MRKAGYLPLMGTKVVVTHSLYRVREGRERSWGTLTLREPRTGWVVGVRPLQNGTYYPPSGGGKDCFGEFMDDFEPGYLACKTRTPCIMVVFWPTERPVPVPLLDGYRIKTDTDPEPYPAAGFGTGSDRDDMRRECSEYAKKWKRDPHGRFLKGG